MAAVCVSDPQGLLDLVQALKAGNERELKGAIPKASQMGRMKSIWGSLFSGKDAQLLCEIKKSAGAQVVSQRRR